MKKIIALLSLLPLLSCSAPEGVVESFYDSGQLEMRTTYIDGYKKFKVETFSKNGNLKAVADGKEEFRKCFQEDKEVRSELCG
jgi:antitoxin component YwqK of YwqJK toxin-antitoxin module